MIKKLSVLATLWPKIISNHPVQSVVKILIPKTENPNLEDWDFSLTLTTNNHKTKFIMH